MKSMFLFILPFITLSTLSAQSLFNLRGVRGEGATTEKQLDVKDFDAVVLSVNAEVFLTQGETFEVTAKGQKNILELIDTRVINGEWKITFTEEVKRYEKMEIDITLPSLSAAKLSGVGKISTTQALRNLTNLDLAISGIGNLDMEVYAAHIDSKISGMGNITLSGEVESLDGQISGTGNLEADNLLSSRAKLSVSGMGDCEVNVQQSLEVKISGIGSVSYKGSPETISQKISGMGKLRAR